MGFVPTGRTSDEPFVPQGGTRAQAPTSSRRAVPAAATYGAPGPPRASGLCDNEMKFVPKVHYMGLGRTFRKGGLCDTR
jgi:hypothetical protein